MKKGKNIEVPPTTRTDGTKVTLKKATVKEFLAAANAHSEFIEKYKVAPKPKTWAEEYDGVCYTEEEKAFKLCDESGNQIAHFTFINLASACYDVLGSVVEVEEKYCKILQLLGIEVTE